MLKRYFKHFKSKWNIQSNWQLVRIMTVFALAGQSILFTMPLIRDYFGISPDINIFRKILFFIFFSFPIYQFYLIFWAIFLGEFRFFVNFCKDKFSKI
jgi:hypothetical protein